MPDSLKGAGWQARRCWAYLPSTEHNDLPYWPFFIDRLADHRPSTNTSEPQFQLYHIGLPLCNIVSGPVRSSCEMCQENRPCGTCDLVENSPRLHFYPLCYDRHYCVMNTGSVLASRESLSYQDLSGFTILTPSEELCPGHMRRAIAELKRINKNCMFELGHDTNNVTLQLMSSDRKLAMMPGYTRPTHQNLVSVPLENGIAIRVGVAYLETLSTLEKAFLSTSYQVLKINGIKGA